MVANRRCRDAIGTSAITQKVITLDDGARNPQDTQRNSLVLLPLSPDTVRNFLPQGAQPTTKNNH